MDIAHSEEPDVTDSAAPGGVVGVVLAAGAGRRYGMPKILAAQGQWLENAVSALRDGGCDVVLVAMGAAVVAAPQGATAVVVDEWESGLSASVRVALETAGGRPGVCGVVLHVVDMPDVSAPVIRRVLGRAQRRRGALARAVYGGLPGHPVYVGADHLRGVTDSMDGDVGAGPYLRAHADIVDAVECGDLASGLDRDEP